MQKYLLYSPNMIVRKAHTRTSRIPNISLFKNEHPKALNSVTKVSQRITLRIQRPCSLVQVSSSLVCTVHLRKLQFLLMTAMLAMPSMTQSNLRLHDSIHQQKQRLSIPTMSLTRCHSTPPGRSLSFCLLPRTQVYTIFPDTQEHLENN